MKRVLDEQESNIISAVEMIELAVINKKKVYIFGASHAGILAEEVFYRAGGFALFNPIMNSSLMLNSRPITTTSQLERLEGFGRLLGEGVGFNEGDILICHSVSGRNAVAIDLAIQASKSKTNVIALTNVASSKASNSRHSSGKRLLDVADLVLDNCGDIGDATVSIPNMQQKVSATSTVVGAAILNGIVAELAHRLSNSDVLTTPPFFYSANIDGGDEHNQNIFNAYQDQIDYQ